MLADRELIEDLSTGRSILLIKLTDVRRAFGTW